MCEYQQRQTLDTLEDQLASPCASVVGGTTLLVPVASVRTHEHRLM